MNKPGIFLILLIPLVFALSEGYNSRVTRYGGLVDDMKYIGRNKHGYMFILYTDRNRIYTFYSKDLPYFSIDDSVMEYWFDYRLKGIGKKDKPFFYSTAE